MAEALKHVREWVDSFPWWSVVLTGFVAGSIAGVILRKVRRAKYESKEG